MAKKSDSTKQKATKNTDVQNEHHHHDHEHENAPRHPEIGENKEVTFQIAWNDIQSQYDKLVKKYQPLVKSPGFRKGKAPAKIVEGVVGAQRLYQEAIEALLPDAYVKAIKDAKLQPISDPEIHPHGTEPGKDWEFHAMVAEKPEISLGKYQNTVKKALSDFDKQQQKAKKDDKKVEDGNKQAKDDKDARLTATLAALREDIKPIIPELLVKQDAERQLQSLANQLKMANIPLDAYLKSMGKSEADLQTEYVGRSLANWQIELILDAIASEQKIEITDADIDAEIKTSIHKPESYSSEQRAYIRSSLKKQKVFDYLLNLK